MTTAEATATVGSVISVKSQLKKGHKCKNKLDSVLFIVSKRLQVKTEVKQILRPANTDRLRFDRSRRIKG